MRSLIRMRSMRLLGVLMATVPATGFCSTVLAQSGPSNTEAQVWPEVDAHFELQSRLRLLLFSGVEQGIDFPYCQANGAAAIGYQLKPFLKAHPKNIDPDKEHHLVLGMGYEFLRTVQSGKAQDEDRVTLDATPGFRLPRQFLVRDRNWIELRWVGGAYSTTYRNMPIVEREMAIDTVRFSPYGSAEVFYNGAKHSWNEEWYTAGVQWPYKGLLMLDTYYRREQCNTCSPSGWNVAGLTMNFFFRKKN